MENKTLKAYWDIQRGYISTEAMKFVKYAKAITKMEVELFLEDRDFTGWNLRAYFTKPGFNQATDKPQLSTMEIKNNIATFDLEGSLLEDFGEWQVEFVLAGAQGENTGTTSARVTYEVVENFEGLGTTPNSTTITQNTVSELVTKLETAMKVAPISLNVLKELEKLYNGGDTAVTAMLNKINYLEKIVGDDRAKIEDLTKIVSGNKEINDLQISELEKGIKANKNSLMSKSEVADLDKVIKQVKAEETRAINVEKTKLDKDGQAVDSLLLEGNTLAQVVTAVMAKVSDGAPEALDTLKELGEALKLDENSIATLTTLIGTKATKIELSAIASKLNGLKIKVIDKDGEDRTIFGEYPTSLDFSGNIRKAVEDYDLTPLLQVEELIKIESDRAETKEKELQTNIDGKEDVITKKTGFNLEKSDSITLDDTDKLATSKATKMLNDKIIAETTRSKIEEAKKIDVSEKGAHGGVATLDDNGKLPSSQFPAGIDEVKEYQAKTDFPTAGAGHIIYLALDTNKSYRWSGSTYVELSKSVALGETSNTAYSGFKGAENRKNLALEVTRAKAEESKIANRLNAMGIKIINKDGVDVAMFEKQPTALGISGQIIEATQNYHYPPLAQTKALIDKANENEIIVLNPVAGVSPRDDYWEGLVTGDQINKGQGRTYSDKLSAIIEEDGLYIGEAFTNLVPSLDFTINAQSTSIKNGCTVELTTTQDGGYNRLGKLSNLKSNTVYTISWEIIDGEEHYRLLYVSDRTFTNGGTFTNSKGTLTTSTTSSVQNDFIGVNSKVGIPIGSKIKIKISVTETDHEVPFIDGSFEGSNISFDKKFSPNNKIAAISVGNKFPKSTTEPMFLHEGTTHKASPRCDYWDYVNSPVGQDELDFITTGDGGHCRIYKDGVYKFSSRHIRGSHREEATGLFLASVYPGHVKSYMGATFFFDNTDGYYTQEKLEEILKKIKEGKYVIPRNSTGTTANIPFSGNKRGDKGDVVEAKPYRAPFAIVSASKATDTVTIDSSLLTDLRGFEIETTVAGGTPSDPATSKSTFMPFDSHHKDTTTDYSVDIVFDRTTRVITLTMSGASVTASKVSVSIKLIYNNVL